MNKYLEKIAEYKYRDADGMWHSLDLINHDNMRKPPIDIQDHRLAYLEGIDRSKLIDAKDINKERLKMSGGLALGAGLIGASTTLGSAGALLTKTKKDFVKAMIRGGAKGAVPGAAIGAGLSLLLSPMVPSATKERYDEIEQRAIKRLQLEQSLKDRALEG